jgi:anaerobic selenocysteine-containing dehydrogenase
MDRDQKMDWHATACILCESNCGIEVRLGGEDGRRFERVRGDKSHPASRGYTCEKALRLDHYQNSKDRLTTPMRRRPDGSFEEIDWETAIAEIADRLIEIRGEHGGESIFYFGGGGQGNHLPGIYASATRRALGIRYRSNALAQEKTGEIWVNSLMFGNYVRGDFEHAEVAVFLGKNPWQSHSIPRARRTLREISADPDRTMIVVDPRRTKTAELADIHLQLRPGTDAWLLAAMGAIVLEEGLVDGSFVAEHTTGLEEVRSHLEQVPISDMCQVTGLEEEAVRQAARRIAGAESVSVFEDLGIQMNRHSTLSSYLEKLIWVLTANFGKEGAQNVPSTLIPLAATGPAKRDLRTPVTGSRIISGLVACSVVPDEILNAHPDRLRAMIVESSNPAHSMPDSPRWREALHALDLVVVIDIAMTETARLADYVLPTPTQYEKWEATTFTFEFPDNVFYLRRPILDPPEGVLAEPEIHARLLEAMGFLDDADLASLREALSQGREAFGETFLGMIGASPELAGISPLVLYRTLGPTLPDGADAAAVFWGAGHRLAISQPDSVARAGYHNGESLFDAMLAGPVVFTSDRYSESWSRLRTDDGRIHLDIPELLAELDDLAGAGVPEPDPHYPLMLSAGERRSFTANTIMRDPSWRRKDPSGALRVSVEDADRLGLSEGDRGLLTTKRGRTEVMIEVTDTMISGHISLPNGLGVDYPDDEGDRSIIGVTTNELTSTEDRDPIAGTPWHKSVPARLEALETASSPG